MTSKKIKKNALQLDTTNSKFHQAFHQITARLGPPLPYETGTKISKFKRDLPGVFDRAASGSMEVVTLGNQRFVIISEEKFIALSDKTKKSKTLGELFEGLPTLSGTPPRVTSIKGEADQYSVLDGKTRIP
jgi:hypothetical protein